MGFDPGAVISGQIIRNLKPRAGEGALDVHLVRDGYKIVLSSPPGGVEVDIAMLKSVKGHFHLYWKRSSGRWVPYKRKDGDIVMGTLAECLEEIKRDPQGVFWK